MPSKKYQKPIINNINSAYNFTPLSKYIHFHQNGEKISHNLPFKKGLSGELNITLLAESAISLGECQKDQVVKFFRLKNGEPAIPGSSIRGMVRSVFEIATFSKFQFVDDKTFGLRDLSGSHVKKLYLKRLQNKQKAGYLQLINGKPTIIPCEYVRLENTDINKLIGQNIPNGSVAIKNKWWMKQNKNSSYLSGKVETRKKGAYSYKYLCSPTFDENGEYSAVFTGNTFNRKREFAFKELAQDNIIIRDVDKRAWGDFLSIHSDDDETKPWSYWKNYFNRGEKVPVFYLQEDERLRIGLAFMMKLAGDFTTHDLIANTNPCHLNTEKLDYTEAVFGMANDADTKASLKSRVQFELAIANNAANIKTQITQKTVLSEPKASFFPNYIEQPHSPLNNQEQYQSYIENGSVKSKLRGWKRYPVETKKGTSVASPPDGVSEKVKIKLEVIPANTTFNARIIFHNLLPEEIGALIWSLELEKGNHSIGTAKSNKFGQLKVLIPKKKTQLIIPNYNDSKKAWTIDLLKQYFEEHMENSIYLKEWKNSIQIRSLLAMSNAELPNDYSGKLQHMPLKNFVNAKKAGISLKPFIKNQP